MDTGVAADIVKKSGSWYSYGEHRLGQGRENAKDFLIDNPEIALEIETKVRETFGLIPEKEDSSEVKKTTENKTK